MNAHAAHQTSKSLISYPFELMRNRTGRRPVALR